MSTIEQTVGELLNEQDWTGKIFSDGWVDAPETIETIEPATGEVLGTAGVANAASVAAARSRPRALSASGRRCRWPSASRSSAARPSCSSATGRRSQAGWCASPARSRPKAAHEIGASIGQLDEAASLISHPLEHELPSLDARGGRRPPAACRSASSA